VLQSLQLNELQYDATKVNLWTNMVIDSCLKGLQGLGKPFKYIGLCFEHCTMMPSFIARNQGRAVCVAVTCIIMQKNGAGMHTAAAAFWDTRKDGACCSFSIHFKLAIVFVTAPFFLTTLGMCKVPWENATMHCIVTVFGLAVSPSAQTHEL
jgi:dynein light chain Tctex-type 1